MAGWRATGVPDQRAHDKHSRARTCGRRSPESNDPKPGNLWRRSPSKKVAQTQELSVSGRVRALTALHRRGSL